MVFEHLEQTFPATFEELATLVVDFLVIEGMLPASFLWVGAGAGVGAGLIGFGVGAEFAALVLLEMGVCFAVRV